ncbi:MAG: type I-E CRISPR-associated protein Cas5/CasD [Spirochaetales bacterium]|nr:type I-E CRISPR-associated protein Cas5/CasD [Spirochaetales bacterium]
MKDYLIFRLYGPLAAWGTIAVGEERPSFRFPTKSAIMGLCAAAMGIRRDADPEHIRLSQGLGFAVKTFESGSLLRDYHTIQTPGRAGKNSAPKVTRRQELSDRLNLGTILSSRDYYCDSLHDVAIWAKDSKLSLPELREHLQRPKFQLYLGRKACTIALPLKPEIIAAETLKAGFQKYKELQAAAMEKESLLQALTVKPPFASLERNSATYHWEDKPDSGLASQARVSRRDAILSRQRWQFLGRNESYALEKESD